MDTTWLNGLFVEAGLEPDEAAAASARLVGRWQARHRPSPKARSLLSGVSRDPMASFERLTTEHLDGAVPLVDPRGPSWAVGSVARLFEDAGLDPVVAMAYAKVMVEMYEVEDLYGPLWRALGRTGAVDIEALAQLDWTSVLEAA